jgi:polar amino acid transport system substrate-binding protein
VGAAVPLHGLFRTSVAAAAVIPTFKTVEAGQLTVAMNGDMPMTSVKDGKIIGIDGEIIGMLAERLGLKAKPALMEWSATIEAIKRTSSPRRLIS